MIAITGMGAVSALGADLDSLRRGLLAGEHGIATIERWEASEFTVQIAAHVRAPLELPEGSSAEEWSRGELYAAKAAAEAWRRSECAVPMHRVALVLGTMGVIGGREGAYADRVADTLGIGGPRLTVSTACTSSPNAIGLACDLLDAGDCDAVIAGGADELTKELFAGFDALGVLSRTPCAPFSEPYGTSLGEGAGFVVLERDRAGLAYVRGYGLASDAHHATTPHPRGAGVARAMRSALVHAGLESAAIGYISAHATGTASNDVAEWTGTHTVFGDGAAPGEVPVSGSKSQLGHAQGAAGALELITTVLASRAEIFPPTLRFVGPRARGPRDPIGQDAPRPGRFENALCASSAFGGANCSVIVSSEPDPREPRPHRSVYWRVHASAGDLDESSQAYLTAHQHVRDAADLRGIAPRVDPRGMDPATRSLIAAALLTLGGEPLRGASRDRAGIILGSTRVSPQSLAAYRRSLDARGYAHADAAAFSRVILHAPAGAAALACALRGPASSVHAGAASGLAALAYAATMVATRSGVDRVLAAGLDETEAGPVGALCGELTSSPTGVRVAGWAISADPDVARRDALRRAGLTAVDAEVVAADLAGLEETPSLRSLAAACEAVAQLGQANASALALAQGEGASCGIVFVREAGHG